MFQSKIAEWSYYLGCISVAVTTEKSSSPGHRTSRYPPGVSVLYRETHNLLDDLAEAAIDGTRKETMELFVSVPLLIIDDLRMRKLP
jgi:DNA replication protein DnaC